MVDRVTTVVPKNIVPRARMLLLQFKNNKYKEYMSKSISSLISYYVYIISVKLHLQNRISGITKVNAPPNHGSKLASAGILNGHVCFSDTENLNVHPLKPELISIPELVKVEFT